VVAQAVEVEQHACDDERPRERAAPGFVGAGDEPDAEAAIEREQLGPGALCLGGHSGEDSPGTGAAPAENPHRPDYTFVTLPERSRARLAPDVGRPLASALFAATAGLLAIAVVLTVSSQQSSFDMKGGYWTSEFLLVGLGGTAALLTAGVGLVIALNDPRNAIAWIFLGGSFLLAANLASNGYGDWTIYGGKPWPGSAWAAAFGNWSFIPAVFVAPALVAQLFPNAVRSAGAGGGRSGSRSRSARRRRSGH
jgi:hypothetical protein